MTDLTRTQQVGQQAPQATELTKLLDDRNRQIPLSDAAAAEAAHSPQAVVLSRIQSQVVQLLERGGLTCDKDGTIRSADVAEPTDVTRTARAESSTRAAVLGERATLGPIRAPSVAWTAEIAHGARGFANTLDIAGNDFQNSLFGRPTASAPVSGDATTTQAAKDALEAQLVRMRELSADLLLALFLKLNITDPNNSVETHAKLNEAMTKLRELAIYEAKKKIELAQKLMKEAEEGSGGYFSAFGMITQILSLVSALFTFGAALAAQAAAQAAIQTAQQTMQQITQQLTQQLAKQMQSMTQQQIQQMLQKMTQEQLQQMAKQMGMDMAQNMTKDQLVQQLSAMPREQLTEALSQQLQQQVTQIGEEVGKQTADFAKGLADKGLSPEQMQQEIQQYYQKAMQQALEKSFGQASNSVTQLTSQQISQFSTQASQQFSQTFTQNMQSALQQAKSITNNSGLKTGLAVGQAGAQVAQAKAAEEAALKAAAANEARNNAARWKLIAEMAQQQLEAENEIIKMIVESKNNTVDAVIKMMNAMFASSTKLMSASMSR